MQVLTGLAEAPSDASNTASALTLWALSNVTDRLNNATRLRLSDVVLVLPQPDYAALLAAALRGAAWKSGAVVTALLFSYISDFTVGGHQAGGNLSRSSPSLLLASYEGFGVQAVNLRVQPISPLPPEYQLPDLDTLATGLAASGNRDVKHKRQVRLGVGLGLGLGLPVVLGMLAAVLLLRARGAHNRSSNDPSIASTAAHKPSSSESPPHSCQHTSPPMPDSAAPPGSSESGAGSLTSKVSINDHIRSELREGHMRLGEATVTIMSSKGGSYGW